MLLPGSALQPAVMRPAGLENKEPAHQCAHLTMVEHIPIMRSSSQPHAHKHVRPQTRPAGFERAMERTTVTFRRSLVLAWCMLGIFASLASCSRQPKYAAPPVEGGNIVISIAPLPLNVPQYFTYPTQGKHVDFFVIRMHDRVLSFLDACITCYPQKLGYRYEEGSVVCRACDTRYSIYKLEKGIGGCFPIKVEGKQVNGAYLIARSVLDRHAAKF